MKENDIVVYDDIYMSKKQAAAHKAWDTIRRKTLIGVCCQNLLCHRRPTLVDEKDFEKTCKTMKCPDCGWVGFMPSYHVLKTDQIIEQIKSWRETRLFRECFRLINFEKLPGTLQIQGLK